MTNKHHTVLYTGVTGQSLQRIVEHKKKIFPSFTSRYNINKLVLWEEYEEIEDAIKREKQIKKWSRKKKIFLIEQQNPEWKDLFPILLKKMRGD